jgi:hypothetical protein
VLERVPSSHCWASQQWHQLHVRENRDGEHDVGQQTQDVRLATFRDVGYFLGPGSAGKLALPIVAF